MGLWQSQEILALLSYGRDFQIASPICLYPLQRKSTIPGDTGLVILRGGHIPLPKFANVLLRLRKRTDRKCAYYVPGQVL